MEGADSNSVEHLSTYALENLSGMVAIRGWTELTERYLNEDAIRHIEPEDGYHAMLVDFL